MKERECDSKFNYLINILWIRPLLYVNYLIIMSSYLYYFGMNSRISERTFQETPYLCSTLNVIQGFMYLVSMTDTKMISIATIYTSTVLNLFLFNMVKFKELLDMNNGTLPLDYYMRT